LIDNFSPGWGFECDCRGPGGAAQSFGALLAALFFGALRTGANSMQTAVRVDVVVVYIIQGLAIIFLIASSSPKVRRWLDKWWTV
jgi:simple sugar transport system permease protein